jgi:PHD/YefM family antitoxin component YafN of YafNO toxin-antitoxin module
MLDIINVTKARSNLSKLISEVSSAKKSYILIRDSIPQAVLIPYDEYVLREENWQREVGGLRKRGKKLFAQWLTRTKTPVPKTEDEVYQVVDSVAGRR